METFPPGGIPVRAFRAPVSGALEAVVIDPASAICGLIGCIRGEVVGQVQRGRRGSGIRPGLQLALSVHCKTKNRTCILPPSPQKADHQCRHQEDDLAFLLVIKAGPKGRVQAAPHSIRIVVEELIKEPQSPELGRGYSGEGDCH